MMKRRASVAISLAFSISLCLLAQSTRDAYRSSYRSWKEGDPNLEQDAGSGGAAFAERTGRAAALAAKYAGDRTAFLRQFAAENEIAFTPLENATAIHATAPTPDVLQRYVASEMGATDHYLQIYAKDTDPGIMQVREALDQEHAALAALSAAITERAKAAGVADDAEVVAEQARRQALDEHTDLVVGLKQAAEQSSGDAAAWTDYYRKLAEGAKGVDPPPPTSVSGVNVVHPANPATATLAPAITPVPLVRYTGAWMYPTANGLFHGPQPVFVDLGVREESGHATGTLFARFKLPPGNNGDPLLRLEFSGEFKNSKSQAFKVVTAEGAKGTIELIPGPAFNLLEVNVETEPKPGKIQRANMVLVKK